MRWTKWRYVVPLLLMAALAIPLSSGDVADPSTAWCIPPCFVDLEVRTGSAINITVSTARLRGNLTSLGEESTANVSFEWGLNSSMLDQETPEREMDETGPFNMTILGLARGTSYYYRAKAETVNGTAFGAVLTFTLQVPFWETPDGIAIIMGIIIILILIGLGIVLSPIILSMAGIGGFFMAFVVYDSTGSIWLTGLFAFLGFVLLFAGAFSIKTRGL